MPNKCREHIASERHRSSPHNCLFSMSRLVKTLLAQSKALNKRRTRKAKRRGKYGLLILDLKGEKLQDLERERKTFHWLEVLGMNDDL